jgi:hypothetical protein
MLGSIRHHFFGSARNVCMEGVMSVDSLVDSLEGNR